MIASPPDPERHRHQRQRRLQRVRRRRERTGVVRGQTIRAEVARPDQCVPRVVVQEPRLVDDPEQDGDAHDGPQGGEEPEPGGHLAATIAAARALVCPTASNVVIRRVAVFFLLALAVLPASADAARKGRVTPAGWAVRPAGAEISVARTTQGFQGPLGLRCRPAARRSSASRARRPASTRPTCSTCASASGPARSPTTRAAASARRCSTASRSAPAASARGPRAAGRASSTSTTSVGR